MKERLTINVQYSSNDLDPIFRKLARKHGLSEAGSGYSFATGRRDMSFYAVKRDANAERFAREARKLGARKVGRYEETRTGSIRFIPMGTK